MQVGGREAIKVTHIEEFESHTETSFNLLQTFYLTMYKVSLLTGPLAQNMLGERSCQRHPGLDPNGFSFANYSYLTLMEI